MAFGGNAILVLYKTVYSSNSKLVYKK